MAKKFDFSGWATRANMLCSDGRTIMKDAFKECDGTTVPLVWNHQHNSVDEVLGHALLENRKDGVYAYGVFNDTPSGQNAKLLVQNGDVNRLSIYANKLKQQGGNVIHGVIRELSLVLAGANPGAYIDSVMMHGEDSLEEGYICPADYIENIEPLFHSDGDKKGEENVAKETKNENTNSEDTIKEVFDTLTEKQKEAVYAMFGMLLEDTKNDNAKSNKDSENNRKNLEHAEKKDIEDSDENDEETVWDVFNTLTEKQKEVVYALIGHALTEADVKNDDSNENEGGTKHMKHNVFDQDTRNDDMDVLTHSEMEEIFTEARRNGSLADTVLQHGITNIDYLFPEAQAIDKEPGFIKRPDDWVTTVMNSVHKTPFSRIKSIFADITADEARAKGYIKENMKVDEVFSLLKRTTTPTTVYKKQKIDRDDAVDITDFDVVVWLKKEMRMMLDEEIARAILIGDGRQNSSNDKINEQNIRPIWTDEDVYTIKVEIPVTKSTTDDEKAKAFIKATIKSRKEYKGSGNPDMFISEDMLTSCLLLEDKNGRVIYDSVEKLATALRVRNIVPVPVMENRSREKASNTHILAGIYVNLIDYNVGADKGGSVNMFDDFDIDYNAMKYLIETRCSGAMTSPYSAAAIEFVIPTSELSS